MDYVIQNTAKIALLVGQHFYLFIISTACAILLAVGAAIIATWPGREAYGKWIITVTGAMQSVPSVAVVAMVFIFVGIGTLPSVIALVIYSIVPILFNTASGLLNIPYRILESAKGMGLTDAQILFRVKIPMSMTVIMAGIRSAATINIGTATVASFIGGGGLGDLIFMGLKLYRTDMIFTGAALTAVMAVCVDFLLKIIESKSVSYGLRLNS